MTIITETPEQRQLDIEREMVEAGVARYRNRVQGAVERGDAASAGAASRLVSTGVEPLSKAVETWIAEASTGKAGRSHSSLRHMQQVEPLVAAFVTVRAILNYVIPSRRPLTTVARLVGRAIEDEAKVTAFFQQDPEAARLTKGQFKSRDKKWHRTLYVRWMNRSDKFEWEGWTQTEAVRVGSVLIDLCLGSTGLFEVTREHDSRSGRAGRYVVGLAAKTAEWIRDTDGAMEALTPVYLPCVVQPKAWTGMYGGGYLSRRLPLIKAGAKTRRAYSAAFEGRDMTTVYAAINAMQDTGWRVNRRVLDIVNEVWSRGLDFPVLPSSEDEPLPVKPHDIDTNEEARREWRRAAAHIHDVNDRLRSKRLQVLKTIGLARRFVDEPVIYFPYQLDWRGRMYAVPLWLNPQGPDYAKALLTFAEGKSIDDEVAAGWLAIHGANCWGHDKVPLVDRIAWVEENEDAILATASDPLASSWWTEADAPWTFLAFCFEWAAFKEHGWGYKSSLPVALDGTCNGLQHYSAMLRDPVGGAAVNLVPAAEPQDIYAEVAKVVEAKLREVVERADTCHCGGSVTKQDGCPTTGITCTPMTDEEGQQQASWAQTFLDLGVDRKLTKRQVMVLPYGGTVNSCREYTRDALIEKAGGTAGGVAELFGTEFNKAAGWLSMIIWEAIGSVVVAARSAMDWLQSLARATAADGRTVSWDVPSGFWCEQAYMELTTHRIKTKLNGEMVRLDLVEQTSTIDKRRQPLAIAPNFIHSMDAAALALTVELCLLNGVSSFATVHDSYGTHAADTEMMAACLRHAFVDMYRDSNPLAGLDHRYREILTKPAIKKLAPLPEAGSLDIEAVLESDFFFS